MQRLDSRLKALEGPRRGHIDARSMSTSELEAIVSEAFEGRRPTDDELRQLAATGTPEEEIKDANS